MGARGYLVSILRKKRLKLSCKVDECKPLPSTGLWNMLPCAASQLSPSH